MFELTRSTAEIVGCSAVTGGYVQRESWSKVGSAMSSCCDAVMSGLHSCVYDAAAFAEALATAALSDTQISTTTMNRCEGDCIGFGRWKALLTT